MGQAVAVARFVPMDGGYEGELQLQDARTRMEPTERATSIRALAPVIVAPRTDGRVHLVSAYAFETDFGNGYSVSSLAEAVALVDADWRTIALSFGYFGRDAVSSGGRVGILVQLQSSST